VIPLTLNVAIFLAWRCSRVDALSAVWTITFLIGLVAILVGTGSLLGYAITAIRQKQVPAAIIATQVAVLLGLLAIYVPAGGEMARAYLWITREPSADIFEAIERKLYSRQEVVAFLDADPKCVNACNECGDTPLHKAIAPGRTEELVELLIARGANVNARDKYGWTPLFNATDDRRLSQARILISHGADVNAKDSHGNTPLHDGARWANAKAVELLLASGADVNAKNDEGETPLDLAIWQLGVQMEGNDGDKPKFKQRWEGCIQLLKLHGAMAAEGGHLHGPPPP
jgi:hypothetical protein